MSSAAWTVFAVVLLGGTGVVFFLSGDLAESRIDRMLLLIPRALWAYWMIMGAWRRTRWGRPAPEEIIRREPAQFGHPFEKAAVAAGLVLIASGMAWALLG